MSLWKLILSPLVLLLAARACADCEDSDGVTTGREHAARASVVVSGTVRRLVPDNFHSTNTIPMFKGDLFIKRIFKGEEIVEDIATLSPGLLRSHQVVRVEGLGDPAICDNMIQENDTKIFMLVPNGGSELKLNSSILPLTLNNLNLVDHVVNDVPLVTITPKLTPPCYLYFCPFGGTCRVDDDTLEPRCECEQVCPQVFAPVCGSDQATYSNPCMLQRASCLTDRLITVEAQGRCGVSDPCEREKCMYGAECLPSQDGKTARCQCPADCPSYGDSVGSKPICGTDGQDYANMCEMRKAACFSMKEIRIKYHGRCDPCDGHSCLPPSVCQVGPPPHRVPECNCNIPCTGELEPVCGSDGNTYSNECMLERQGCKDGRRDGLQRLYEGRCTKANNPCRDRQCGPHAECLVDRNGDTKCVCPPVCQPILRQVCGNDSVTYDNECELKRQSCLQKKPVSVHHRGQCGTDSECEMYMCNFGAICVDSSNGPICQCPQCSDEYEPVCGENGITYENKCKLDQENCQREEDVQVALKGACDGCGKIKCDFYGVCEYSNNEHKCSCPEYCVEVDAPVCGSDGVTYSSECELRVESCRKKRFLSIASTGYCNRCFNVVCSYHAKCEDGQCICPIVCPANYDPVCGTDSQVYANECEMRQSSCRRKVMVEIKKMGPCDDEEGSMEVSGSGDISGDDELDDIDMTPHMTTKRPSPECTKESCSSFEEFDEDPCNGMSPLVNPNTGADYDCSDGKDLCPAQSYCHMTSVFSKCCKDDASPIAKCSDMKYGCCPDGRTPAKGPRHGGCPESCECNSIGSFSTTCDPRTKQCTCKPGVGGKRCDRCNIGYWGLHRISQSDNNGNTGCIPCNCNKLGSDRDDCDQMTGRCVCKPHITGMKCDQCQNGNVLGIEGCSGKMPETCDDMPCQFGATCREEDGRPLCVCDFSCDKMSESSGVVCGSDGQNYGSDCQLNVFSCRLQKEIIKANDGSCKGGPPSPEPTSPPVTRPSRKTTRHIDGGDNQRNPGDDNDNNNNNGKDEDKCMRIDEVCIMDQNCCPSFSRCHNGLCKCHEGYIPALDNNDCFENKVKPPQPPNNTVNACSANPCENGKCLLDERMGFRCACELGYHGPRCDKATEYTVPSFSGHSFLSVELQKEHINSKDLIIDIEVKPLNQDGILLFASKYPDGSGDFVSLAVKNGFVEFRYDLGGGEALIKSRYQVELGRKHRIVAQRFSEKANLIVDDEKPVSGSSPPTHKSLDLKDNIMLGQHQDGNAEIYDRIGVDLGLVGCIYQLRIGQNNDMYTFVFQVFAVGSDITNGVDISECSDNPCNSLPCKNGATCFATDELIHHCQCRDGYSGYLCQTQDNPCSSQPCQYGGTCVFAPKTMAEGFYCDCVTGRAGDRCERESLLPALVPQFTGDSFMTLQQEEKLSFTMAIELWFQAFKPNGVMLLVTQKAGGGGDFICLSLENKKLVFTFYLGSGTARIESKKHIHLDTWHKVKISRHNRDGEMIIDDKHRISGVAEGKSTMLNIDNRPIYLGGFNHKKDLPARIQIDTRFTGVIQRAIINGRSIDSLMSASELMSNVSSYNGPPCDVNPCMNGGICIPMLNLAGCRCPSEYIGKHCDKRLENVDKDQPVKFDGMTFLKFANEISRKQKNQKSNMIEVTFRTTSDKGVLLLQSSSHDVNGDFLCLAVNKGRVELTYNLGKNGLGKLFTLRSSVNVTDGDWHTAYIERHDRAGSLQIDSMTPVSEDSAPQASQLNTDGLLWLGGRPKMPMGLPVMKGFVGCVREVAVDKKSLHLVDDLDNHSSSIKFCS